MYEYTISQWFIFFYIYCFLGWCFESAYVSFRQKKLVNRGFMHGPLLPLYGSGAVIVLFAALPFRGTPVLVYFVGMAAATILEYCVGVTMESLFKVRYWDYSNQKFNIQGHVCLSSSIIWGFFSLGMVYGMHKPFERFVLSLPGVLVSTAALLISIVAAADFMASLKTALDIRDLLIQAENMKAELGRMKRRMEILDTFARAQLEEKGEQLIGRLEETVEDCLGLDIHIREKLSDTIEDMTASLEKLRSRFVLNRERDEKSEEHMEELHRLNVALAVWGDRFRNQLSKDKRRMLRRNPTAKYLKLPGFLEELREGEKE